MAGNPTCHCGRVVEPREPDPWEGRMDDYCADCATNRCDCYPDECPVKYPPAEMTTERMKVLTEDIPKELAEETHDPWTDDPKSAANEIEKRTTRVGICFADYETFWWAADRPEQSACPACSTEDEDYAANHRFYVAEETK